MAGIEDFWTFPEQEEEGSTVDDDVVTNTKGTTLERFLEDVKLEKLYKNKLSLSTILQIDTKRTTNEMVQSKADVARYFLKRLMMTNVTSRNVTCAPVKSDPESSTENFDDLLDSSGSEALNPLDIVTALFLCSDGFVQQELSLKMSMCQFAVPLLLPNCDTNQCTLMLWALRDIVKMYRPKSLSETTGFKEERIVQSEIPMISFVRLGDCSLSKSQILNKLLSSSQQYHDTFVHRDMEGGDCPRTISDGLAEITWYLPCGNENINIFDEPVAVVNLRGDIASFETQYAFLCEASSAVFVFFDNLDADYNILRKTQQKEKIHLVVDQKNRAFNLENLKKVATQLGVPKIRVLVKTKTSNDAHFVSIVRDSFKNVLQNANMKTPIEKMVDIALNLGISVDENKSECQKAKEKAFALMDEIVKYDDLLKFKESQLPLQGQIWKDLTLLEKEECRLRKVGNGSIEHYKSSLQAQKQGLREKQRSHEMTSAMCSFISAISSPGIERSYFLKWLRINLDNLSHEKLSDLREQYKNKCNDSKNKEEIKEIDKQLSNSSLGTEHFFREMGQIYEAAVSLPKNSPSFQQLEHLPKLCAQLLLDGFPLELVDGDASNIPLRWVSDVLAQLNELVSPNNKILVVTVLGVQGTGKSTLLNTMFGVQFAVSSGRCTRGAFMLLIKISEDMKATLNCDFLVIIDTEGLKSPELATLENSYEHDNELATFVVGLSDISIINIAMENYIEMKDILQIVVHAFLRMKEVGRKPKCQFVHQNVSDVSARERNLRDRKLLLQQLNEMTQAAAKMERKENNKSFTDVMDYDPDTGNWYIPGLWNGNPPMAPVNAGYSEAVYELKGNLIQILENHSYSNNILDFCQWMTSLWNAVKHENFIYSFRNSLVADAYMTLCSEYNKWEWEFKKAMYTWITNAETKIKNFGIIALGPQKLPRIEHSLAGLKREATDELFKWETVLLNRLAEYFKQKEGHVYLVEGFKQEFENNITNLTKVLKRSLFSELSIIADMKRGQAELDRIKEKHTQEIGERVHKLIKNCRKKKAKMTDAELDREFDAMWNNALKELEFCKQEPMNIFANVIFHLRWNMKDKGSHACQELSEKDLKDCGLDQFKYTAEGRFKLAKNQIYKWFKKEDVVNILQMLANRIIADCQRFVTEKVAQKNNYHETFISEILHIIDTELSKEQKFKDMDFEISLKQHICATTARQFQKMHEDFLDENDPYHCLSKNKERFCADFKDLFNQQDQCQKKATEFTEKCLKVAVKNFVRHSLGIDIIDEMLACDEFSTRMMFQYSVLLDLLEKDAFSDYLEYTMNYEHYIKEWILHKIYARSSAVFEFEKKHIQSCVHHIKEAVVKANKGDSENLKSFVEKICKFLGDKLVIPKEALDTFLVLNNANKETFAHWLISCVNEMEKSLPKKLKRDIEKKLQSLPKKPQDELFKEMIGCGKQCPFCKAPCDAGTKDHSEHWASLHRPKAFGAYKWSDSRKLNTDICSSAVITGQHFQNADSKNKGHPYKSYKEIYQDWKITADSNSEASDYWKYVLTKFNKAFAEFHNAEPADIPESWKSIDQEKARESIEASFCFRYGSYRNSFMRQIKDKLLRLTTRRIRYTV